MYPYTTATELPGKVGDTHNTHMHTHTWYNPLKVKVLTQASSDYAVLSTQDLQLPACACAHKLMLSPVAANSVHGTTRQGSKVAAAVCVGGVASARNLVQALASAGTATHAATEAWLGGDLAWGDGAGACVCVYMCACEYACVCRCVHARVSVCMCVCVYVCVCVCECVNVLCYQIGPLSVP